MGFGRGVGFTPKIKTEQTTFKVKGGGGKATKIATEKNPTYTTSVS